MEDDLDVLGDGLRDERGVADVAEPDVERARVVGGTRRRASRRAAGVVEAERADVGALGDEALDQVAADEPVGAGDEHRDVAQGHAATSPGLRELVALADVDPVVLDLERPDRLTAASSVADEVGRVTATPRSTRRTTAGSRT